MDSTEGAVDHELRQTRLSRFGRVLAFVTVGYVGLNFGASLWLHRLAHNRSSVPLLVSTVAFAALWLLLRGAPRSPRFVRAVELSTLFVGTAAISTMAVVMDLVAEPDMIVRSLLIDVLLVYAVYVPSTARHTLVVAALMTLPLLGSIFVAFRAWDPAVYDPPAATWPKGQVGDMAYPATILSTVWWGIAVAMAAAFSQTIYGLRKAVSDIRRLGQYTLEERLGRGGMGEVWSARHRLLMRPAAIKIIRFEPTGRTDPAVLLRRFEREAHTIAALRSPHTVALYDFGQADDGTLYYVMEKLVGMDLESLVEQFGPVPAERAIHILKQACHSLDEAHRNGLTHRDIKPANIFVSRDGTELDFVKVLDFGLVRLRQDRPSPEQVKLTAEGVTSGTPAYMAPEIVIGDDSYDHRVDLYAIGCVGYWLVTGKLVFEGDTAMKVMLGHLNTPPPRPQSRTELAIPAELEQIILDCLEKDPARRPASAAELARRLSGVSVSEAWTAARAERWWATHTPEHSRARPVADALLSREGSVEPVRELRPRRIGPRPE